MDMKQHEEVFILICLDDGDEDHSDDDICDNTNGRGGAEASPRSYRCPLSVGKWRRDDATINLQDCKRIWMTMSTGPRGEMAMAGGRTRRSSKRGNQRKRRQHEQ